MVLHLESFEVSQVIEEMVTTLQPAAAKNGNSIHVHLGDNVNMMRADITKVRQILFNLPEQRLQIYGPRHRLP